MPLPSPEAAATDFAACRALLRQGSKIFSAASLLLPAAGARAGAALYAFCRVADDAIDLARRAGRRRRPPPEARAAYAGTPYDHPVDRAFSTIALDHELPRELVPALSRASPGTPKGAATRPSTALTAYAARVAGTVGAMMALLMGTRAPEALARACDLGVAMQLTNIARDVGEDARNGRIYLPLDWLGEAGVDPLSLVARPAHSDALAGVIERLVGHADTLYARAEGGIAWLPRDCRAAIRAAGLIYADIGRVVARRGFDAISGRAVVSGRRKLWLVLCALFAGESEATGAVPALPETQFLVDAAAEPPALPPTSIGARRSP